MLRPAELGRTLFPSCIHMSPIQHDGCQCESCELMEVWQESGLSCPSEDAAKVVIASEQSCASQMLCTRQWQYNA